jgi:hypothetical protein
MTLTAGATLQNQKYVIQKQLHQSDFGVTYQAQHAYLGRPVVLQTLSDALQQRHNFDQLRQHFLSKVRAIAQQPTGSLKVLDCFEEDGMPFVVFERGSSQSLAQLTEWIPVEETSANSANSKVDTEKADTDVDTALERQMIATAETLLPNPETASASGTTQVTAQVTKQATVPVSLPSSPLPAFKPLAFKPPAFKPKLAIPTISSPRQSLAWLPMGLAFTSMLAGLLGAGAGFFLRFAAASQTAQTSETSAPRLSPHLFSREQAFPSKSDWPISETPQLFTPTPDAIQEPVYRSNSADIENYQPSQLPSSIDLPSEPLPAAAPAVKATTPIAPPEPVAPLPPEPAPIVAPPAIGNAPVAPVAPEPAPPPPAPEPLPPTIELPVPSAAPEAPAIPREPRVLKN